MNLLMTFIQKRSDRGLQFYLVQPENRDREIRQFKSWNPGYHVYGRYFRSDGGILL